jgi:hypothetical protein
MERAGSTGAGMAGGGRGGPEAVRRRVASCVAPGPRPSRARGRGLVAGLGALAAVAVLAVLAGCGNASITIYAGPEQTPQSIALTATVRDATSVTLDWTSAGSGLAYRIERNGNPTGTTSALNWVDGRLEGG